MALLELGGLERSPRYLEARLGNRGDRLSKMKPLVWLDLCSGLGGASQPALDRGWRVIRIDIDPRFKPDIVADVRALPLKPFHVDVLWASPPCREFSKFEMRCFFPDPPEPNLSIVHAIKAVIDRIRPRFWMVENVRASRRWLSPLFGQVRMCSTGHAIWSNLAFLVPNLQPQKGGMGYWNTGRWGAMGHAQRRRNHGQHKAFVENNAAVAAKIPYEIGDAICRSVEARLEDYGDGSGRGAAG